MIMNRSLANRFSLYILLGAAILLPPSRAYSQPQDTLDVLFVGNSFTFYWNLPQVVGAMAASQGIPMRIRQSTASGATWEQHWKGEKGLSTQAMIKAGRWDVVVLQNHSTGAIDQPVQFDDYGKKWIGAVRASGAEPLLFLTWAYHSNPLQQAAITEGYTRLGAETGTDIAPVGPIWSAARRLRPDLDMYADDKHPSPEATYLIGLIFFKKLTGMKTASIPSRLQTRDQYGENLYLSILAEEDAAFFRQLTDESDIPVFKGKQQKN